MNEFDIAIIGGGPAGLMASVATCRNSSIAIFEKTDSLGKKLLLTGGGRCNITNNTPIRKLLNLFNEKNFLKHSFYTLTNEKLLNIFETKGLEFKEEEDKRVFPITDDASSVLDILKSYLTDVNIFLNYSVSSIVKHNDKFIINNEFKANKVIIATGGITYPQTGSSGDGYKLSYNLKQPLSSIKYGLVPLISDGLEDLAGTTLYNVIVSYKKFKFSGDVLISHFGLSGPPILNISNKISEDVDYDLLNSNELDLEDININIDLVPDFTFEELNNKFIKDSSLKAKLILKNYLKYYLTSKFISFFLDSLDIDNDILMANLTKKDRNKIISSLKGFNFKINGFKSKLSKVTIGGVRIDKINSKTMESTVVNNLYFAGEVLEPAGLSGGFNLKIAFSTGYLAGLSASK